MDPRDILRSSSAHVLGSRQDHRPDSHGSYARNLQAVQSGHQRSGSGSLGQAQFFERSQNGVNSQITSTRQPDSHGVSASTVRTKSRSADCSRRDVTSMQPLRRVQPAPSSGVHVIRNRELIRSVYYGTQPRPLQVIMELSNKYSQSLEREHGAIERGELQPIGSKKGLVASENYTVYKPEGQKYKVVPENNNKELRGQARSQPNSSTQEPEAVFRQSSSAPSAHKDHRAPPLPKINNLVNGQEAPPKKLQSNPQPTLRRHAGLPSSRSMGPGEQWGAGQLTDQLTSRSLRVRNTHKLAWYGALPSNRDPETGNKRDAGYQGLYSSRTFAPGDLLGHAGIPTTKSLGPDDKFASNWADKRAGGMPNKKNDPRGAAKPSRDSSHDSINEKIERQPTTDVIYMGGSSKPPPQKQKRSPYLQNNKPSPPPKHSSPTRKDTNKDFDSLEESSNAPSSQSPRRETTKAHLDKIKAILLARAKTQDALKIQRTKTQIAKVEEPHTIEKEAEKREKDLYKLEDAMHIYFQDYLRQKAKTGIDPRHTTGKKEGSPESPRKNVYTDPKRNVPPWHRKEYVLTKREAEQYTNISTIYGKEVKTAKQKREENFYKKCLQLQVEAWRRIHEEYANKIRRDQVTRDKQAQQLVGVREKFEDEQLKRFQTQYVTSRILAHEWADRHVYGLPEEAGDDPQFKAVIKPKGTPRPTFDSKKHNEINGVRYRNIFWRFWEPKWDPKKPKMADGSKQPVSISDEMQGNEFEEDPDDSDAERARKKRVRDVLRDAQAMLDNEENDGGDEADWEDDDDSNDNKENNKKVRFAPPKKEPASKPAKTSKPIGVRKSVAGKPANKPGVTRSDSDRKQPDQRLANLYKPKAGGRGVAPASDFRKGPSVADGKGKNVNKDNDGRHGGDGKDKDGKDDGAADRKAGGAADGKAGGAADRKAGGAADGKAGGAADGKAGGAADGKDGSGRDGKDGKDKGDKDGNGDGTGTDTDPNNKNKDGKNNGPDGGDGSGKDGKGGQGGDGKGDGDGKSWDNYGLRGDKNAKAGDDNDKDKNGHGNGDSGSNKDTSDKDSNDKDGRKGKGGDGLPSGSGKDKDGESGNGDGSGESRTGGLGSGDGKGDNKGKGLDTDNNSKPGGSGSDGKQGGSGSDGKGKGPNWDKDGNKGNGKDGSGDGKDKKLPGQGDSSKGGDGKDGDGKGGKGRPGDGKPGDGKDNGYDKYARHSLAKDKDGSKQGKPGAGGAKTTPTTKTQNPNTKQPSNDKTGSKQGSDNSRENSDANKKPLKSALKRRQPEAAEKSDLADRNKKPTGGDGRKGAGRGVTPPEKKAKKKQPGSDDIIYADPSKKPKKGTLVTTTTDKEIETTTTKKKKRIVRELSYDEDDEDATPKKKTTTKEPVRKPPVSTVGERPNIPTPDLESDTDDDDEDIFEKARRKYGIVLDSEDDDK